MTMWGGRFSEGLEPDARRFNASIGFDRRLAVQDVYASAAWARALESAGVLPSSEAQGLLEGLTRIQDEVGAGRFAFLEEDEDIHTAVERRLGELVGPLAGKLHTGRSRNDQVATDVRLWLLDNLPALDGRLSELQLVLIGRAEAERSLVMPGYTHLQRAQPITLGHWWMAHVWPLQRDRLRLRQVRAAAAWLPLGAGALAGTAFPIDRRALAVALGFDAPCPNSLDAVADRDFAAEFLFAAALTGIHLSRLAEAVILFSTQEFGFFELADAYATGSSLMPQKKNADVFELARGKAGTLIGQLTGLLSTLKALPSAYDKDLQEDKVPLFQAYDTLLSALPALTGALRTLSVHPETMAAAVDETLMAVDLADHLAELGVPFRQAHAAVGQWVRLAQEQGRSMSSFSPEALRAIHPALPSEVKDLFDPATSLGRRQAFGGTAPSAVTEQLAEARRALASLSPMSPASSGVGGSR
jgi:argininosuccinate lyase